MVFRVGVNTLRGPPATYQPSDCSPSSTPHDGVLLGRRTPRTTAITGGQPRAPPSPPAGRPAGATCVNRPGVQWRAGPAFDDRAVGAVGLPWPAARRPSVGA